MDLYSFAPIAALLDGAYSAIMAITALLEPVAGTASAALAIVLVTLLVRTALIPVGISQIKATNARRRLAPQLAELQKKHKKNREVLQRKTMELYQRENVSPTAGCLPLLLQLPVVSIIYGLFIVTTINGHPNALLTESVFGMPLGASFVRELFAGTLGLPAAVLMVAVVAVIAVVAQLSRTLLAEPLPSATAAPAAPAVPAPGMPDLSGAMRALTFLPFVTAIIALFVPLAAALYMTITTIWTFGERAILRRIHPAQKTAS